MGTVKSRDVTIITTSKDTLTNNYIKTITIEKFTVDTVRINNDFNCDCLNPIKDVLTSYSWPLLILLIIILFKKQITNLIDRIKELNVSKEGIKIITKDEEKDGITPDRENIDEQESKILLKEKIINKILSTFWRYQKEHKSTGHNIRWTFTLLTSNSEYVDFINGIGKLVGAGLVTQDLQSQQFYLTDKGIEFCDSNEIELTSEVFKF